MKTPLLIFLAASFAFGLGQQITLLENQPIYIEYSLPSASTLNSIYLSVIEIQTKKKASVQLTPSSLDKKIFNGYFRIQMDMNKLPSQILEFQSKNGNKLFAHVLPNTKANDNSLSVSLFNTETEWQNYTVQFLNKAREELVKQQNKIKNEDLKKLANKNDEKSLIVLKEKKEELSRFNDRIQEQTRLSFETQEALKREQQLKLLEAKTLQEKENAKKMALEKADNAFKLYQAGKYKEAVKLYEEASSLDPENDVFYYQYAVTLYKVGNYNKSLSVLSLSEGGDQNPLEHRYYVALNHLKLNELEKSASDFRDIKEENDKRFSPVSAFYAGNIEFQRSKYKESREHFQYVLDFSSDPKLDKDAELKIEEIDRIENFLESQKEILKYAFFIGPQYDGNVLNMSTQNLATNLEAYRLIYGGTLTYNMFRTMKSLYSLELGLSDIYSVDKSFKSDSTIQSADPLQFSLRAPINYQWNLMKKEFYSSISPYYSSLSMSDDGGSRKQILTSTGLSFDLTWSGKKTWSHIIRADYVKDVSTLVVSSEDDNQSATRSTFGYSLVKILNAKADKSILTDLSYIQNAAIGKNNTYNKYILGLSYNFPWSAKYKGSSKIEYTDLKYPQNIDERKDSTWIASLSASQDLTRTKNISLSLSYNMNGSNLDTYKYDKMQIGFLYSYTGALIKKE